MEKLYIIEEKRREFLQEIIDRYLYLSPNNREAYIKSITELNNKFKIEKRQLQYE